MGEKGNVSGASEWETRQKSKAGGLEDALNHPNNLIMALVDDEEIAADAAFEAKEKFGAQLAGLQKAPDYKTITQATLDTVSGESETTDWENKQELETLISMVRGLLDSAS